MLRISNLFLLFVPSASWAYALSQHLFIHNRIPPIGRLLLVLSLTLLFVLLLHQPLKKFLAAYPKARKKAFLLFGLLAAIIIALLFVLLPYQLVPFRTTHTLEIRNQGNTSFTIQTILSPDEEPLAMTDFQLTEAEISTDGMITIFSGGSLHYTNESTGGTTVIFQSSAETASAAITWDGVETVLSIPAASPTPLEVHLSGSSWGNPSLEWKLIALFSTAADYLAILSLALLAATLILGQGASSFLNAFGQHFSPDTATRAFFFLLTSGLAVFFTFSHTPYFMPIGILIFVVPSCLYFCLGLIEKNGTFRLPTWLSRRSWFFLLLAIAIPAVFQVLDFTREGMGLSGDSVVYLEGARNLLAGNGFYSMIYTGPLKPITGFPPLFPLGMAGISLTGIPLVDAGRMLNAFLFGVNILLVGILVHKFTRSTCAALLGACFIFMAPNVIIIHAWLMTEPLFFTLTLTGLLLYYLYLENPRYLLLFASAAVVGLSVVARLAGITFLAVACLGTLIFLRADRRRKWVDALLMGAIGIIPFVGFSLRNFLVSHELLGERAFTLLPFPEPLYGVVRQEFTGWLLPLKTDITYSIAAFLIFVLFLAICLGIFSIVLKRSRQDDPAFYRNSLILFANIIFSLILIYVNIVIWKMQVTDYGIRRYLTLVFILSVIWVISVLYHAVWKRQTAFLPRAATLLVVGLLLALNFNRMTSYTNTPSFSFGYLEYRQHMPEVVGIFQNIPSDQHIISNNCELVYYFSQHPCEGINYDFTQFTNQFQPGDLFIIARATDNKSFTPLTDNLTLWQHVPLKEFFVIEFYTSP
jgi:hypothetical protein